VSSTHDELTHTHTQIHGQDSNTQLQRQLNSMWCSSGGVAVNWLSSVLTTSPSDERHSTAGGGAGARGGGGPRDSRSAAIPKEPSTQLVPLAVTNASTLTLVMEGEEDAAVALTTVLCPDLTSLCLDRSVMVEEGTSTGTSGEGAAQRCPKVNLPGCNHTLLVVLIMMKDAHSARESAPRR